MRQASTIINSRAEPANRLSNMPKLLRLLYIWIRTDRFESVAEADAMSLQNCMAINIYRSWLTVHIIFCVICDNCWFYLDPMHQPQLLKLLLWIWKQQLNSTRIVLSSACLPSWNYLKYFFQKRWIEISGSLCARLWPLLPCSPPIFRPCNTFWTRRKDILS